MFRENRIEILMFISLVLKGKSEPPFACLAPHDWLDIQTAAEMLSILQATGIEPDQLSKPIHCFAYLKMPNGQQSFIVSQVFAPNVERPSVVT